jgi:hypothetical protein
MIITKNTGNRILVNFDQSIEENDIPLTPFTIGTIADLFSKPNLKTSMIIANITIQPMILYIIIVATDAFSTSISSIYLYS